ncbi:MAG: right-handed parallel beta-helix repeat-containing protein [Bacteroidia bacterium]
MKTLTTTLVLMLLFGFTSIMAQPLSGSYSIDAGMATGGTNYQNFTDAVSDLTTNGISGNVIFNIASGTYPEQITIPWISGSSPSDSIIFQSATGDSTDVVLTYNAGSSANYTLQLDSTAYITFQNLTLRASNLTYGRVVLFTDYVKSIHFLNNHILGTDANGAANSILVYGNNIGGSDINFENNRIEEGANGIYLNFKGSSRGTDITIANNFFLNNFLRGIDLTRINFLEVRGNKLTTDDEATGYIGIFLFDVDSALKVIGNQVSDIKNVALYLQFSENSSTDRGLIANNFFHARDNGDAVMLIRSNEYLDIFHNSVNRSDDANQDDYALEFQFGNNNRIWNNNIANTGGGPAIYYHRPGNLTSDYNNLNVPGCNLGRYTSPVSPFTESYPGNLVEWQATTGLDPNSISVNPAFKSDKDLHSSSFILRNAGVNTSQVSNDFDGEPRSNPPDIGADEIMGPGPYAGGTYTVPGDFVTIQAAVDSLAARGIGGNVVLNITPGTYNEQVEIGYISRASISDSIIIQSSTQDSSDVIIQHTSTQSTANWTILLDQTEGLTLQHLSIRANNNTYGHALVLTKRVDGLNILNNSIEGTDMSTNGTDGALIYGNNVLSTSSLHIERNLMSEGTRGISLDFANSAICLSNNTVIAHNQLSGHYDRGISIQKAFFLQVLDNDITSDDEFSKFVGIYLNDNDSALQVMGNYVSDARNIALELRNSDNSGANRGLVANNFVHSTGNGNTVLVDSNSYLDFFHNSVHQSTGNGAAFFAFVFASGDSNRILNNIFANSAGGAAAYYGLAPQASDFNNFYSTTCYLGRYINSYPIDLAEWQSVTGLDANSFDVNPSFESNSDLHSHSSVLDGAGVFTGRVPGDFDGEARNNPPDIGADEFTISQSPYAGGTYTVPGNFATIQAAMDSLEKRGIAGTVLLNIASGTYNEQVEVGYIERASSTDSIIIQSSTQDSSDVVIEYASMRADSNWTVLLDGTEGITIRHLTIRATGTNYGRALVFSDRLIDVNILNNAVQGTDYNGNLTDFSGIFTEKLGATNLRIRNNLVEEGAYGIYLHFNTFSVCRSADNLIVAGNKVIGSFVNGIDVLRASRVQVLNNEVTTDDDYCCGSGIYLYQVDSSLKVTGNYVYDQPGYALYLLNSDNSALDRGLVANNFFHSDSSADGVFISEATYLDVFHNSVHKTNNNSTDEYAFVIREGSDNRILNNIFANSGGGPAAFYFRPDGLTSDYNGFFSTSCNLGRYDSTAPSLETYFPANLAEWQAVSGLDMNSLQVNPAFASNADLHSSSISLNNVGMTTGRVPNDFDGEARNNPPDIGADEYGLTGAPPYAGTYSVPTDFATIQTAVDSFAKRGINGNVVLNIATGTYNEQIEIPNIQRSAAADTIIIQSSTLDTADVIIEYAASQADSNWTILLDNVKGLTLRHLTIRAIGGAYDRGIAIQTQVENVNILNNALEGGTPLYGNGFFDNDLIIVKNQITASVRAIDFSYEYSNACSSNSSLNHTVIDSNIASNGVALGYALNPNIRYNDLVGPISLERGQDALVANNQLAGGVFAFSTVNLTVRDNELSSTNGKIGLTTDTNTTIANNRIQQGISSDGSLYLTIHGNEIGRGISVDDAEENFTITQNQIFNVGGPALEVRRFNYPSDAYLANGLIANNFIYSTGSGHGVHLYLNTSIDFHNNSVHKTGNSDPNVYAFVVEFGGGTFVKNNILVNSGGGPIVFYYDGSTTSDYNNFFGSPCIFGRYGDLYLPTDLAEWQVVTRREDAHSFYGDPMFLNDSDLHINIAFLDGAGTSLSQATMDFDGEPRNNPQDIGADEFTYTGPGPYAGTYSVPTDFATIQDAVDSFTIGGMTGNVVLNIEPGTYNEQVEIGRIHRFSSGDSIIIQSENQDSADVIIEFASTSSDSNWTVLLAEAQYLTLQHLTIRNTGGTTALAIQDRIREVNILNNQLEGSGSKALHGNARIDDLLIANNQVNGIYMLTPQCGIHSSAVAIVDGNISDEGIYIEGINMLNVQYNIVTADDLEVVEADTTLQIIGNHIYDGKLKVLHSINTSSAPGLIANNFVSGGGIDLAFTAYMNIYHNSVNSRSDAFRVAPGPDNLVYNNSFVSDFGFAIYIDEPVLLNASVRSDYNNLLTNGTYLAAYDLADPYFTTYPVKFYEDLADWQQGTLEGTNSVSVNPGYVNDTDLHASSSVLNGTGKIVSGVPLDIDKETRGTPPDIGADEFSGSCPGAVITFTVYGPSCNGDSDGAVKATVTGGTPPYTFLWSTNETTDSLGNLSAGKYFLEVGDANGCTYFDTADIVDPAPLGITALVTGESSNGASDGAIDITVSGGTTPYSYLWNNSATSEDLSNIGSGNYKVIVTDSNGCQDSAEYEVDLRTMTLVVKVTPSSSAGSGRVGFSTVINGDWAMAGAPLDATKGIKAGAVYVYKRNGGTWTTNAKLTSNSTQAGDKFGFAVGIDDTLAIVGAPEENSQGFGTGVAYVFARRSGSWVELQTLTAPTIKRGDFYGYDVAIFGERIAIGSFGADLSGYTQSGAVYIYERSAGTWAHTETLLPNDVNHNDYTGLSVDMYEDRVVAGSPTKNSGLLLKAGAAYVWKYDGAGNWAQEGKLVSGDLDTRDSFGISVAVVDSTVIVGAYGNDDDGNNSGSAYIFQKGASTYAQTGKLTASDGDATHLFGHSVGITNDTAIVGAYADDHSGIRSGSAYLFANSGGWGQFKKLVAPTPGAYEDYGFSVDASEDWAMVGAKGDGEVAALAGAVYFYHLPSVPTPILVHRETNLFDEDGEDAGNDEESAISAFDIAEEEAFERMFDQITVYPNPARDRHDINISIPEGKEAQVQIIDAAGNFVVNRFEYGPMKIHNLRAGVYFLRIQIDAHVYHRKLVVVK